MCQPEPIHHGAFVQNQSPGVLLVTLLGHSQIIAGLLASRNKAMGRLLGVLSTLTPLARQLCEGDVSSGDRCHFDETQKMRRRSSGGISPPPTTTRKDPSQKKATGPSKLRSGILIKMLLTAPYDHLATNSSNGREGANEPPGWARTRHPATLDWSPTRRHPLDLSFLRFKMREILPTSEGCHED